MSTPTVRKFAGVVLAVSLVAACSDSTAASGPGGTTAQGLKTVHVDLFNGPYMSNIGAGAQAAATELGAEFTQTGPTALNPGQAIGTFQNAVASGAQVALVMAYPGDLWRAPIDAAVRQGVTVATNDDSSDDSQAAFHIGPPKVAMGAALADEFAKKIPQGATGTIIPGLCVPGLAVLQAPINGFRTRMGQLRPGVTVAEAAVTNGD
nr:substrate-binding domain-containing protein [Actinomycetota bacterium]